MDVRHLEPADSGGLARRARGRRDFVGGEPVLVQQGDALLRERMHGHMTAFARERLDALALRLGRERTAACASPTPGYLLSPRAVSILLRARRAAPPVAGVRAAGGRVRVQRVDGCLPCHGDQETLLDEQPPHARGPRRLDYEPTRSTECSVQGPVVVHPTARVERTLLRGPVVIGPGAADQRRHISGRTRRSARMS